MGLKKRWKKAVGVTLAVMLTCTCMNVPVSVQAAETTAQQQSIPDAVTVGKSAASLENLQNLINDAEEKLELAVAGKKAGQYRRKEYLDMATAFLEDAKKVVAMQYEEKYEDVYLATKAVMDQLDASINPTQYDTYYRDFRIGETANFTYTNASGSQDALGQHLQLAANGGIAADSGSVSVSEGAFRIRFVTDSMKDRILFKVGSGIRFGYDETSGSWIYDNVPNVSGYEKFSKGSARALTPGAEHNLLMKFKINRNGKYQLTLSLDGTDLGTADDIPYGTGSGGYALQTGNSAHNIIVKEVYYGDEVPDHNIQVTAGEHGTVSEIGTVSAYEETNKAFVFRPDDGYVIDKLSVDERKVKARNNRCTLKCIVEDHTLNVTFAKPVASVELNKTELTLEAGAEETLTATVKPDDATYKTVTWSSSDPTVATVTNGKVNAVKEGTAVIMAAAETKTVSCNVTVKKVEVASVELNKTELTLETGAEETLAATVKPDDAADKTVTWSSSDPTIATVADGKVKAVKEGTAVITAAAGSGSATCTVTVKKPTVQVTSIRLNKIELTLEAGTEEILTAIVKPDDATYKTVIWGSYDPTVATVDNGKVKAAQEGSTTIEATAGGRRAFCRVTVTKPVVEVTSVELNKTELTLEAGAEETLTATVKPDDAADKTVTWSSSDPTIATVADGKVKAVKEGTAVITAAAGSGSATCTVTVKKQTVQVTSIRLNKIELTLEAGAEETLTAIVEPDDAADKTVIWGSYDPTVAAVDNGKVKAVKEGSTIIEAIAGNKRAFCIVTVTKPVVGVTSVELNKTELTLKAGTEETLTAIVKPEDAADKTVTWSSSDPTIATVTNGKVNAVKEGTAVITAEAETKTASCTVIVTNVEVTSVKLDKAELTLKAGAEETLTATVKPDDAANKTVTWSSSDPTIATVADGKVKAVKEGTAVITAAAGSGSATCTVTVKKSTVEVTSVELNKIMLTLEAGAEETLTATVKPDDATDKTVIWKSYDPKIATVTNGKIKAVKEGIAIIEAAAGDKSALCVVTVTKEVLAHIIQVTAGDHGTVSEIGNVSVDKETDKTFVFRPDAGYVVDKVFVDGEEAEVKDNRYTFERVVEDHTLNVTFKKMDKPEIPAISVKLNKKSVTLEPGQEETLTATIEPMNTTDKTVTWSSSDPTVATVDNGKVKAVKAGTAVITAAAGTKSAACTVTVTEEEKPLSIAYSAHIQNAGWAEYVRNGESAGTEGMGRRLEALRIKLENSTVSGDIQYRTQVEDIGWQGFVSNDQVSGTEGMGKRLEALQIKLTGEMAEKYDVYYRTHIQDYGWLDWAANGASAGSEGMGLRMEAMEIQLVEKGQAAPGKTDKPFITPEAVKVNPALDYASHVQNIGWQDPVKAGEISGSEGMRLRLEALKINLDTDGLDGSIQYRTQVEDIGWQEFVSNDQVSGTEGMGKRLEALQIKLTGEMAEKYDVYYRTHIQDYGWLDWAANGASAGSEGMGLRMEAIEIQLAEKGQAAPGKTDKPFIKSEVVETNPTLNYASHVQDIGWQNPVKSGEISGSEGMDLRLEALKINLDTNELGGSIQYATQVQNIGWQDPVQNHEMSGTSGKSLRLEAINIRLTGEIAEKYDIYYRTHIQDYGWLDWALNGENSGSEGKSLRMEAMEIRLVEKGQPAPGNTDKPFIK